MLIQITDDDMKKYPKWINEIKDHTAMYRFVRNWIIIWPTMKVQFSAKARLKQAAGRYHIFKW